MVFWVSQFHDEVRYGFHVPLEGDSIEAAVGEAPLEVAASVECSFLGARRVRSVEWGDTWSSIMHRKLHSHCAEVSTTTVLHLRLFEATHTFPALGVEQTTDVNEMKMYGTRGGRI